MDRENWLLKSKWDHKIVSRKKVKFYHSAIGTEWFSFSEPRGNIYVHGWKPHRAIQCMAPRSVLPDSEYQSLCFLIFL